MSRDRMRYTDWTTGAPVEREWPRQAHAPDWWERWADRHADQVDRGMTALGWATVGLSIGYFAAHVAVAILRAAHIIGA